VNSSSQSAGQSEVLNLDGAVSVRGLVLVDLRPARKPTLARLEKSTGRAVLEVHELAEEFGVALRAELNDLAGGEAPASVMAMGQLAVNAIGNLHKAQLMSDCAVGDWSEARLDEKANADLNERANKTLRNLAGLAVVARDLLQSARSAAKEARSVGSPTEQLMTRLGVGGPARVPISPPGVGDEGAPLPQSPLPKRKAPNDDEERARSGRGEDSSPAGPGRGA